MSVADLLSLILQSGILVTLLGIAYKAGKVEQHFNDRLSRHDEKLQNHEQRIEKLEDRSC